MGLILHSQQVTQPYMDSFWEDWNRLDDTTDTDIDGIPDFWEVVNGLSRTNQDSSIDTDGDGLSNLGEYSYGSDPTRTIPMEIVSSMGMKSCGQQLSAMFQQVML